MPHYDYSIRNKELVLENIKLKEEIDRLLETIRHLSGDKELLIEKQDRLLKELGQLTLNFAVLTEEVEDQRKFDKEVEASDNYTFDDGMTDEDLEEYVKKATSTERVEGLGMLFNEAVNEAEKDMITQDDLDAVFAPDNEEEKVTLLKQEELNTLLTPDGGQTREAVNQLFNKDKKPENCCDCYWYGEVVGRPKDCEVEYIDLEKYVTSRHPDCHLDKGEKK